MRIVRVLQVGWSSVRHLRRFLASGAPLTGVEFVVFLVLNQVVGVPYLIATGGINTLLLLPRFFVKRVWVFECVDSRGPFHLFLYAGLEISNVFLDLGSMYLLVHTLHEPNGLAKALVILVLSYEAFVLSRWIFTSQFRLGLS